MRKNSFATEKPWSRLAQVIDSTSRMACRRHSYHVVLAPIGPLGPRRLLPATVANTPSESPLGERLLRASGSASLNAQACSGSADGHVSAQTAGMARNKRKRSPKTVLKLPDLEQPKSAVLNSLTSPGSQRSYDHAIREFIDWYCSEPRLASTRPSSPDTASASNRPIIRRPLSTSASRPSGDLHMRPPTAAC